MADYIFITTEPPYLLFHLFSRSTKSSMNNLKNNKVRLNRNFVTTFRGESLRKVTKMTKLYEKTKIDAKISRTRKWMRIRKCLRTFQQKRKFLSKLGQDTRNRSRSQFKSNRTTQKICYRYWDACENRSTL
jgi:hypothetical protein